MHRWLTLLWIQWFLLSTLAFAGQAVLKAPEPASHRQLPGKVFILSAPSGTGKTTLVKQLLEHLPGLAFAVSHTTRAPRPGEQEGVDYFFVDDAQFDALLAKGSFVESVAFFGHRYGLSWQWLQEQLASGKDVLLDLNTSGARSVRRALPEVLTIFLLPPSAQELARRLRGRGSETAAQIALRMEQAKSELARFPEYDYLVVNEKIEEAFREVESIILASRARKERRCGVALRILEGF